MNKFFVIVSVTLMIVSCSTNEEEEMIVKVYDVELKRGDISFLFDNKNLSSVDSIKIAKKYIDNWVEEQILLHQSQQNKTINLKEIDDKANHYKNLLIINQLENQYVQQNLDTNITEKEFITYYKNHKDDFQLKDYLVKILYIKVPSDAPNIIKLEKWYKLHLDTDIKEIKKYANTYATNFYYDIENWIYFDDITKEIPLKDFNKDRFITRKSKTIVEENDYFYFLNVIDYKLKNTTSPLEFEKENIKQRILNKRVKALKEKYRKENIEKAYNEKAITIY